MKTENRESNRRSSFIPQVYPLCQMIINTSLFKRLKVSFISDVFCCCCFQSKLFIIFSSFTVSAISFSHLGTLLIKWRWRWNHSWNSFPGHKTAWCPSRGLPNRQPYPLRAFPWGNHSPCHHCHRRYLHHHHFNHHHNKHKSQVMHLARRLCEKLGASEVKNERKKQGWRSIIIESGQWPNLI